MTDALSIITGRYGRFLMRLDKIDLVMVTSMAQCPLEYSLMISPLDAMSNELFLTRGH